MIGLEIDGRSVDAPEGSTILEAARRAGVEIPTLCHHPSLSPEAACGICLVEVAGRSELVRACSERASDGMRVCTETDAVMRARSDAIGMIMMRHGNDCAGCDSAGLCELSEVYFRCAQRRPIESESLGSGGTISLGPRVLLRPDRCIACGRCVRFAKEVARCDQIELDLECDSPRVTKAPFRDFDSAYSVCACDICPTGALVPDVGEPRSVGWRLESHEAICTGCSRACAVWLDSADGRAVRLRPRRDDGVNGRWMCDFGRQGLRRIFAEDRPRSPMIRDGLEMKGAGWDEAISAVADRLRSVASGKVVVVLSAQSSVEENAAFLWLAKALPGCGQVLLSGREDDLSFADGLLRRSDRNVNSAGAASMAGTGLDGIEAGCGVIVLGSPGDRDVLRIVESSPAWAVLVTSDPLGGQRWADVVLPKLNAYEQRGTYVPREDEVRVVEGCLPQTGETRSARDIALAISKASDGDFDRDARASIDEYIQKRSDAFGGDDRRV